MYFNEALQLHRICDVFVVFLSDMSEYVMN